MGVSITVSVILGPLGVRYKPFLPQELHRRQCPMLVGSVLIAVRSNDLD